MQRDALVRVQATGSYGSVFSVGEDGVCEVGLIDPVADDYSLKLPQPTLEELPWPPAGAEAALIERLALFHLRVRRGMDVDHAFEAYLGRNEGGDLELWFAPGASRAERCVTLDERGEGLVREALVGLRLDAWRSGGGATPSLGSWSWSAEVIGDGMGMVGYGRAVAAEGLAGVVAALARLGLPVECAPGDGPRACL